MHFVSEKNMYIVNMFKFSSCLFVLFYFILRTNAEILCEVGFCRNYGFDTGCATPAQECRINNATHSGLILPSPTTCNCCEYCLPKYVEGHHCSLGGAGEGTHVGRCDDGLTCVAEDNGNYCRRISGSTSACHALQDDYDQRYLAGETGVLESRPECEGKGRFAHYHCVPTQTCFCQSDEGERLFGESQYGGSSSTQNMHCGCSLLHHKIKKNINAGTRFPTIGPRCTSDGNFNPVQCVHRTCYCVDKATGVVVQNSHVDLDEKPITELPCYEATLDLFPDLWIGEPPYNYTTPCYQEMMDKQQLILDSEELGFNVDYFSSVQECLPDGTYGRVATRNNTKICVDERGQRIGQYEAAVNTPGYEGMDCKCALTSHLMSSSMESPVCCTNGNFRDVQCRRGQCRCVDSDGRQIGREAGNVEELACYTDSWQSC